MGRTAWVAGASGLVGGQLIEQLCAQSEYDHVIAWVRETCAEKWSSHPKVEQWTINYNAIELPVSEAQVDDAFCALGTTAKKTPDKAAYYKVDVTYPLNFAATAKQHGAVYYGLVSANGANARSFSSYLKMKGDLEERLQTIGFDHLTFARPSLLKGDRAEFRLMERVSEYVLACVPGNYRAIDSCDVAAALVQSALSKGSGTSVLLSSKMQGARQLLTHV